MQDSPGHVIRLSISFEGLLASKSSIISPDPIEIPAAKRPSDDLRLLSLLWWTTIAGGGV